MATLAAARSTRNPRLLLATILLLAVNLRTTVASLPPLQDDIERDLALSGWASGLLTALPVVCMAWFAPAAHRLVQRFGRDTTTLVAIGCVAVGNGVRAVDAAPPLLAGTLVAGIGVAVCGVVLPGAVKEAFPLRSGMVTGAYTVAMMLGAAIASALAVPLERELGSWRWSLAVWTLPAAIATAAWHRSRGRSARQEAAAEAGIGRLPWRNRGAWLLAAFLAAQSFLSYAYLAWLAPAYRAHGWSPGAAGALLAVNNLAQLAGALALPALADRWTDRRPALIGAVACTVIGSLWLFAVPDRLPWAVTTVLGVGLGGAFSLAMALIVDYGTTPAAASRLAALAFVAAYGTAALAPMIVGALRDATGGYATPFGLLAAVAVVQLALGTRLSPRHRGTVT
ncbi:MFS transporter [Actinomadura sp. NBRC 104425]|uniref:MFS transporter n=1 Tax=Actinomadura sp. NBRC 104425 TaxID=3032204 RepID=UPI0024A5CF37|nr:MFS transporter [Actinomadura sp. NBRC 104425]GLZ11693.1 MFS transporter [Actinomadura sp. NBRC 104425]